MQPSFLYESAEAILQSHGDQLDRIAVVIPGKRAGLFFREAIRKLIRGPFISPEILTLPDFIGLCAGQPPISRTALLFQLYECHVKVSDNPEDFADFLKWAPSALDDFNDIQHSLVDASALFRELRDIREIESWSFSADELSPAQEDYRIFWRNLGDLYNEFQQSAATRGYGYASLVQALVNGNIESANQRIPEFTWFVGLSSLTKAEEQWVDTLRSRGRAKCLWDGDEFYVAPEFHEAGNFLRRRQGKEEFSLPGSFSDIPKNIRVHECTTAFGQIWATREKLEQMTADELNDCVVVITDDSLVDPLLASLPGLPVPVNVALGLPIRSHPVFRLISDLLTFQRHLESSGSGGIHFEYLLKITGNDLWAEFTGMDHRVVRDWLVAQGKLFLQAGDLQEIVSSFSNGNWSVCITGPLAPDQFIEVTLELLAHSFASSGQNGLRREVSYKLSGLIRTMKDYVSRHSFLHSLRSFQACFDHLIAHETIAYSGEPLSGLQVLNMVETRAVDFRNVIVVGANDDRLPGSQGYQSLIPFDLRRFHAMPLPGDRDATYAYTFYRLLQRAGEIDLYYASITADFKGSEFSRYITQLMLEIPPNSCLSHNRIVTRSHVSPRDKRVVINDDFTRARLRERFARGMSPSSIGTYLRCPLDFYFKYILGLREAEEMEEQLSASAFGDVIHEVMEQFMTSFIGSFPDDEDWDGFVKGIDKLLDDALIRKYPGHSMRHGFNLIQRGVMRQMLISLAHFERGQHNLYVQSGKMHSIVSVETKLEADLPAGVTGWDFPVKLSGKSDRIDRLENTIRIIDYKSGTVDADKVRPGKTVDSWFRDDREKLVQIMSYAYMYHKSNNLSPAHVDAALLSLTDLSSGYHSMRELAEQFPDWPALFEEGLAALFHDMYDSPHFEHREASRFCEYCDSEL